MEVIIFDLLINFFIHTSSRRMIFRSSCLSSQCELFACYIWRIFFCRSVRCPVVETFISPNEQYQTHIKWILKNDLSKTSRIVARIVRHAHTLSDQHVIIIQMPNSNIQEKKCHSIERKKSSSLINKVFSLWVSVFFY